MNNKEGMILLICSLISCTAMTLFSLSQNLTTQNRWPPGPRLRHAEGSQLKLSHSMRIIPPKGYGYAYCVLGEEEQR